MTTFASIEQTMSLRTIKIDDALLRKETPCSYTDEEMYEIVKNRLKHLEDGTASLVDGEEVFSQIQARYGFKA